MNAKHKKNLLLSILSLAKIHQCGYKQNNDTERRNSCRAPHDLLPGGTRYAYHYA